ncbi:MAG: bifunctional oligoribonuclease/PAP phosphatase NrnA [Velocimicrobium sp.]
MVTKFQELLQCITKNHVYIQTHNYPDPDALASAQGLSYLLQSKGIRSTICYKGHIDKYNTLQMIELLQIKIHPESELHISDYDEIILVDCQKGNGNVNDFCGIQIACIDHHTLQATDCYRFFDIQPNFGSCSTIIATYFIENNIPLTSALATLLLYGLKLDTANLTRSLNDLDVDMFSLLYKFSDKDILLKLESSTIKLSDLNAYAKAIEDLRVYNEVGFANIGNDCSEAIIGTLSDFILSINEVHFSMVYSYRAGGLKFSVRSDNYKYDANKIIKEALQGYGDGGGHSRMAAGFIPNLPYEDTFRIATLIEERVLKIVTIY